MGKFNEYKGYKIRPNSMEVELSPGVWEFERYGSVSKPGDTLILDPGGNTYKTKQEADEAF